MPSGLVFQRSHFVFREVAAKIRYSIVAGRVDVISVRDDGTTFILLFREFAAESGSNPQRAVLLVCGPY